jgi:hypothetical protein
MGNVTNHPVLHTEPGDDLKSVYQRDARGEETVELRAEQAREHGLGREREKLADALPGRAYAGSARDFGDVGVVALGRYRRLYLLGGRGVTGSLLLARAILLSFEVLS